MQSASERHSTLHTISPRNQQLDEESRSTRPSRQSHILRSQKITQVVPILSTIDRLCNSVLRRMILESRDSLQRITHIYHSTAFYRLYESPYSRSSDEGMQSPFLVEQKCECTTIGVKIFTNIGLLGKGGSQNDLQACVTRLIASMICFKIIGEASE